MFATSPSRAGRSAAPNAIPFTMTPFDASDPPGPLHVLVDAALDAGEVERLGRWVDRAPVDDRDRWLTMTALHELGRAPLPALGRRVLAHGHPATAALQRQLDLDHLERMRRRTAGARRDLPDGAAGVRRAASLDRVPEVYDWLAERASQDELVRFLAVEGGPDADFDDLVAIAQIGISGAPKVALALNYWDELGRGQPDLVHTELYRRMVDAVDLRRLATTELPVAALERNVLTDVLATHRWLQPELLGALGVVELQAGARCRAVVRAMERVGFDSEATGFYAEHAEADPRHGKDWLDRVVEPLADDPDWARRMADGALWRHDVNQRLFRDWRNWC